MLRWKTVKTKRKNKANSSACIFYRADKLKGKKLMITREFRQELAARMRAMVGLRKKRPTVVEVAGKTIELSGMPTYLKRFYEGMSKIGNSYAQAVKLHCYQCSGYSALEANRCTNTDCPLWIVINNRRQLFEKKKAWKKSYEFNVFWKRSLPNG